MTVIYAVDNEFAVATGDNIDATPSYSFFDNPPNSFTDLVITSDPDDSRPGVFEVGETYSLTYGGHGGGGALMDAVVVRSDPLGTGQGVIVFEGVDAAHGAMQIVWTPNFDLEQWFWDNFNDGRYPAFYTSDTQEALFALVCFVAGTPVETPAGARPVERLRPGDRVSTRDNGPRAIRWAGRKRVRGTGAAAPVRFAPGVLANTAPLLLSQQHRVLLSGPEAELLFGCPEVLVPAKALLNGDSVRLEPRLQVDYVHLLLETHELLAAAGAAVESLFLGDVAAGVLEDGSMGEVDALFPQLASDPRCHPGGMRAARPMLTVREAIVLAEQMGLAGNAARPRPHPHPALLLSA